MRRYRAIIDSAGFEVTEAEANADAGIPPCECRRTRDGIEPCSYCEARAEAEAEAEAELVDWLMQLPEAHR